MILNQKEVPGTQEDDDNNDTHTVNTAAREQLLSLRDTVVLLRTRDVLEHVSYRHSFAHERGGHETEEYRY